MEEKRKRYRRGRRRRYQRRNLVLLAMVCFAALILIGGSEFFLSRAVKKHDDGTVLQGVRIGNTEVSGMTEKEAVKAVNAAVKEYGSEVFSFQLETGRLIRHLWRNWVCRRKMSKLPLRRQNSTVSVEMQRCLIRRYGKSEKGELEYVVPLKLQVSEEKVNSVLLSRSKEFLSVPVNAIL